MQSNFFRYHFGLESEKRKIVRKVPAKRILQTAPHRSNYAPVHVGLWLYTITKVKGPSLTIHHSVAR